MAQDWKPKPYKDFKWIVKDPELLGAEVNGKIYAIGGFANFFDEPALSTVEAYDPATDTWTKKADMPTARGIFSTSEVNGKIYAIGGFANFFDEPALSTVETYDPATDTWTKKADMPTARGFFSTSVVNEKIYAIGGVAQGAAREQALSVVAVH